MPNNNLIKPAILLIIIAGINYIIFKNQWYNGPLLVLAIMIFIAALLGYNLKNKSRETPKIINSDFNNDKKELPKEWMDEEKRYKSMQEKNK